MHAQCYTMSADAATHYAALCLCTQRGIRYAMSVCADNALRWAKFAHACAVLRNVCAHDAPHAPRSVCTCMRSGTLWPCMQRAALRNVCTRMRSAALGLRTQDIVPCSVCTRMHSATLCMRPQHTACYAMSAHVCAVLRNVCARNALHALRSVCVRNTLRYAAYSHAMHAYTDEAFEQARTR